MKRPQSIVIPIAAVLIAMISIQSGASLAKSLFPIIGAQGTAALRLLFASLLLCVFWRPWKPQLSRKEWVAIGLYGISLGGMNLLFYMALEHLPLGIAVAIEFTGPLSVAVLSSRRLLDFLWVAFALAGIVLILPVKWQVASSASAPTDFKGIVYALAAGIFWAFYILFGQRTSATLHSGKVTALGMVAAALVVVPAGLLQSGDRLFHINLLPVALGIALLSSAIPYSLEMFAMKKIRAQTFGILMSLEPALGALSGMLFLKENLSFLQWFAIFCVVLASFGSSMGSRREVMDI